MNIKYLHNKKCYYISWLLICCSYVLALTLGEKWPHITHGNDAFQNVWDKNVPEETDQLLLYCFLNEHLSVKEKNKIMKNISICTKIWVSYGFSMKKFYHISYFHLMSRGVVKIES